MPTTPSRCTLCSAVAGPLAHTAAGHLCPSCLDEAGGVSWEVPAGWPHVGAPPAREARRGGGGQMALFASAEAVGGGER